MMRQIAPLPLAACLALASPLFADDWPQWRGPARDGVAVGVELPAALPASLGEVWSVEVGTGHASPVVMGQRLYVHARVDGSEVVRALNLADGTEIWNRSIEVAYTPDDYALIHGRGPKSTPVVSGESICVLGITGVLTCLDRESGEVRWERDFEGRFDRAWPEFGTAMSPAVFGGRLIAHVGGKQSGALIAFDLESGEEAWSWTGDSPGYSSPVLASLDDVQQIVTQSRSKVVALSPETGKPLWEMPFETDYEQNCVTPLLAGERIIISGLDQGVFALEPRRDPQGSWVITTAWKNDTAPMYMSSPVLRDDLLFGMTDKRKGQLFSADLATGEVRWVSEGREGDNAALILAGDRLLVQTTEGELLVGKVVGESWAVEARYAVANSPTWAHPAVVEAGIVIKDETHVRLLSFGSGSASSR